MGTVTAAAAAVADDADDDECRLRGDGRHKVLSQRAALNSYRLYIYTDSLNTCS